MKITMIETRRGSEDGFTVKRYHEGETYEVADILAFWFIAKGHAYPVEESLFQTVVRIVAAHDNAVNINEKVVAKCDEQE